MKKLLSGLVLGVILSISVSTFACSGGKGTLECVINASKIFVNGNDISKNVKSEVKSINVNGVTFVPLRAIAESFDDVGVYYDQKTKRIDINNELYGW